MWDQKEILDFIKRENKLLRPLNMLGEMPGAGFSVYNSKKNLKVGVLNLMGNVLQKNVMMFFKLLLSLLQKIKLKIIMIF